MGKLGNWRAASCELAEIVRDAGPRVALVGAVACALVAGPMLLRLLAILSGVSA